MLFEDRVDKIIKQVHISDIHFGAMQPDYQYSLLKEGFIKYLYTDDFDIIFINGDLFHKSYLANSSAVYYAMKFINDLVQYCITRDCSLILLKGTDSHDANQLQLFNSFLDIEGLDMRIIETCCIIEVKGMLVKCIPELYNRGSSYYFAVLNPRTPLTVAHCMLEDLFPQIKIDSMGLDSRCPVFNINHFYNSGLVMSGHVHQPMNYKNFYYCGSPYSWQFGEPLVKGFYRVDMDNRDWSYKVELIPIENSIKYITTNIDNLVLTQKPDVIVRELDKMIANNPDYHRFEITVANPSISNNIKVIRNYYSDNKRVKFKVNQDSKYEENKKEYVDNNEQFAFIFDKTLTPFDVLSRYIKVTSGEDISAELIAELVKG